MNIGFVSTYARKIFRDEVDIRLFKYPDDLISALKEETPHILGLSNYPWCSALSEAILKFGKESRRPAPVTVWGGSGYPANEKDQDTYLKKRPFVDFYVHLEGEISFSKLIERFMNCGGDIQKMKQSPILGCHFYSAESRLLVRGGLPDRIKNLDEIPSPYLSGALDAFFDGRLTPMIQSNRGCPFTCSFCHEGADYFNKVHIFSPERIKEELAYIGERMRDSLVKTLQVADSNFAMYPQDFEICRTIRQVREKTGWPTNISVTTGKNKHERIVEAIETIGSGITMSMSVQSMDENVLKNIRRSNIKLDTYMKIHDDLKSRGRHSYAEVILGLPGESRESYLRGMKALIHTGVKNIRMHTLMMLDGTELNSPASRARYGMKGKFRIIPRDFGTYHGIQAIEIEEVCTETNTLRFEDYLYLRGFHLMAACYYNDDYFVELLEYLTQKEISPFDWLTEMYSQIDHSAPSGLRQTLADFIKATKEEVWDSPEEINAFYQKPENYRKLTNGESGGNLLFNTCGKIFVYAFEDFLDYGISTALKLLAAKYSTEEDRAMCRAELADIRTFIWHKLSNLFEIASQLERREVEFQYDILGWKEERHARPLEDYHRPGGSAVRYLFSHTETQQTILKNAIRRYGSSPIGLGIILSRVVTVREFFRNALRIAGPAEDAAAAPLVASGLMGSSPSA
ncbi:radical SAM protein [bacterium]|nr:radical SAM protein [bacterium]